ncbi:sensor histidine kinase [Streptococcus sp. 20-1249]|uniref:sensor histidine kinase n=1 Tax=Streptococcus hepaticus TaxID=3349163 RepID=UPI003748B08F
MIVTHFPDIPRLYTALAESLACLLVCLPLIHQMTWGQRLKKIPLVLVGQISLQFFAGQLPLFFWTVGMALNVTWMFASIHILGVTHRKMTPYLTAKAFISAELAASISWHIYCLFILGRPFDSLFSQIMAMLWMAGFVFVILYYQESKLDLTDLEKSIENRDVWVAAFTSLAIFVLSNIGFIFTGTQPFQDSTSIFILRTTVNLSGIFLLYTQESQQYDRYLREELSSINSIFQLQYKQYQAYRENSELISRKVHDLKHQLYIIRQEADKDKQKLYLDEMTLAIHNFEAKIETGNPILDTILTQKNHYCLQNGINLTCIVQGELLHFMDAMDISALFGNAIDNAIEAVEKITEAEKRLITLKVSQHSQFIMIRLDNYDMSNLDLPNSGFPTTSKTNKDYHGFGLKSMEFVVKKYNGNLTLTKEDNWVQLKILLPQVH